MIFNPTRDQARQFLYESWRKHRMKELLSPLEDITVKLIEKHPEYHTLLEDPARGRDNEYHPAQGETNPFLHLMMHLTIEEQLSIDQPAGVRDQFTRMKQKYGTEHDAQHQMMECLGEMIWQSQRNKTAPDAHFYLGCLKHR